MHDRKQPFMESVTVDLGKHVVFGHVIANCGQLILDSSKIC